MKIYKYELKNGTLICCENIDCVDFKCNDEEIFICFGLSTMCSYCNVHISNGKIFLLSLYELNENQLIKAASELERHFQPIFNRSFKS